MAERAPVLGASRRYRATAQKLWEAHPVTCRTGAGRDAGARTGSGGRSPFGRAGSRASGAPPRAASDPGTRGSDTPAFGRATGPVGRRSGTTDLGAGRTEGRAAAARSPRDATPELGPDSPRPVPGRRAAGCGPPGEASSSARRRGRSTPIRAGRSRRIERDRLRGSPERRRRYRRRSRTGMGPARPQPGALDGPRCLGWSDRGSIGPPARTGRANGRPAGQRVAYPGARRGSGTAYAAPPGSVGFEGRHRGTSPTPACGPGGRSGRRPPGVGPTARDADTRSAPRSGGLRARRSRRMPRRSRARCRGCGPTRRARGAFDALRSTARRPGPRPSTTARGGDGRPPRARGRSPVLRRERPTADDARPGRARSVRTTVAGLAPGQTTRPAGPPLPRPFAAALPRPRTGRRARRSPGSSTGRSG